MTTWDAAYVAGTLIASLIIYSLPGLLSILKSGPRYRAVVWRQLAFGWATVGLLVVWLVLGWYVLQGGSRSWASAYRTASLVGVVAYLPLLFWAIRRGNRAAAAAQLADRSAASPETP